MAAAQDKSNRHETVEEAENHLQESELLKTGRIIMVLVVKKSIKSQIQG